MSATNPNWANQIIVKRTNEKILVSGENYDITVQSGGIVVRKKPGKTVVKSPQYEYITVKAYGLT